MLSNEILIIGISGVTCGGKTTLANELNKILPKSKLISQDDYFLDIEDPRHIWIPQLQHINFDVLSSLDMEKMDNDIHSIIKNKQLLDVLNSSHTNFDIVTKLNDLKLSVYEKIKNTNLQILIVEGFCIFNYKPLTNIFHLKYYFTLPKEECLLRRTQRIYEPPDCPGYFENCAWPEHVQQLEEVKTEVQGIKYLDGRSNNALEQVLANIDSIVEYRKT